MNIELTIFSAPSAAADRSLNKELWRITHRIDRCIRRALKETGVLEKQLMDLTIYGRSFYTPEQQATVQARVVELMQGLKPCA